MSVDLDDLRLPARRTIVVSKGHPAMLWVINSSVTREREVGPIKGIALLTLCASLTRGMGIVWLVIPKEGLEGKAPEMEEMIMQATFAVSIYSSCLTPIRRDEATRGFSSRCLVWLDILYCKGKQEHMWRCIFSIHSTENSLCVYNCTIIFQA